MMRILVTGAAGRLGAVVARDLAAAGYQVAPLGHGELDICDPAQVAAACRRLHPHVIVNCAAFNAVDAAESNRETAFALNAAGPAILAAAAETYDALLIHYSTDFVFDGTADRPYAEDSPTNPLGVYGQSKLEGEREASRAERHYVLRVASLFGGVAGSQVAAIDWMADGILAGRPVRAFVDRTVSPSYVPDVVRATRSLIEKGAPYGTYHCVNSGYTTWFDLAQEVAHQLDVPPFIEAGTTSRAAMAARRPRFCALSNQKLLALGIDMPTWQSGVARHMRAEHACAFHAGLRSA